MAPRESNSSFPDQYLTIDYDASMGGGGVPMVLPAAPHPTPPPMENTTTDVLNGTNTEESDDDDDQSQPPALLPNQDEDASHQNNNNNEQENENEEVEETDANTLMLMMMQQQVQNLGNSAAVAATASSEEPSTTTQRPQHVNVEQAPRGHGSSGSLSSGNGNGNAHSPPPPSEGGASAFAQVHWTNEGHAAAVAASQGRLLRRSVSASGTTGLGPSVVHRPTRLRNVSNGSTHNNHNHQTSSPSLGSSDNNNNNANIDPLAIDPTEPEEEEAWDTATAMYVESVSSFAGTRSANVSGIIPHSHTLASVHEMTSARRHNHHAAFTLQHSNSLPYVLPSSRNNTSASSTNPPHHHFQQQRPQSLSPLPPPPPPQHHVSTHAHSPSSYTSPPSAAGTTTTTPSTVLTSGASPNTSPNSPPSIQMTRSNIGAGMNNTPSSHFSIPTTASPNTVANSPITTPNNNGNANGIELPQLNSLSGSVASFSSSAQARRLFHQQQGRNLNSVLDQELSIDSSSDEEEEDEDDVNVVQDVVQDASRRRRRRHHNYYSLLHSETNTAGGNAAAGGVPDLDTTLESTGTYEDDPEDSQHNHQEQGSCDGNGGSSNGLFPLSPPRRPTPSSLDTFSTALHGNTGATTDVTPSPLRRSRNVARSRWVRQQQQQQAQAQQQQPPRPENIPSYPSFHGHRHNRRGLAPPILSSSNGNVNVASSVVVVTDEDSNSSSNASCSSFGSALSNAHSGSSSISYIQEHGAANVASGSGNQGQGVELNSLSMSMSQEQESNQDHAPNHNHHHHVMNRNTGAGDGNLHPHLGHQSATANYMQSRTNEINSNHQHQLIPSNLSNNSNSSLTLSFGPNTTVNDLKYFAERGCIVPTLLALRTPRLKTLGTRMLADYAKQSNRRVAVASNKRILDFCCRTMLEMPSMEDYSNASGNSGGNGGGIHNDWNGMGKDWPAREYAVETIRSLTATEESDQYLMKCSGLLRALALVARGGPFLSYSEGQAHPPSHHHHQQQQLYSAPFRASTSSVGINPMESASSYSGIPGISNGGRGGLQRRSLSNARSLSIGSLSIDSQTSNNPDITSVHGDESVNSTPKSTMGLVSGKARLHACIAIMNLSCGKSNKIEIASIPQVLEAMRDVLMSESHQFSPPTSSPTPSGSNTTAATVAQEARLKAATCIKNLSNADANDAALLGVPGLVEALGHIAASTCTEERGATTCTTNACLALMNLSISKANKHKVFRTAGVMDALMTVIIRTSPPLSEGVTSSNQENLANNEARIKACSALSNLAIGYDNKIPMFSYPGFVDSILHVIGTDAGEARTKACSILWSFAAEMKNQVPVVQRGDILPTLVRVAEEDHSTEARFKCVAALTLLAESLENAIPLLESGALHPLMDILHEAGPDPTQWKGQTASWCVGFLMNMAQSDEAVPSLRESGVVELLAPLLTLDHYQSLKAAMAVTFVCRYDEDDETYDLLRKTENVIPKIISLLHNTLSGRGGSGYKYGVFTLRSSVGCISSLASGPEFMKERIATGPVFESLLRVVSDFCVNGGTPGEIVGGGRDDALSATLAVRALQSLTSHLIPIPGSSALPFGPLMDQKLMIALESFEMCSHPEVKDQTRHLAADAKTRIQSSQALTASGKAINDGSSCGTSVSSAKKKIASNDVIESNIVASLAQGCCGLPSLHAGDDDDFLPTQSLSSHPAPGTPSNNFIDGGKQGMGYVECDDSTASSSSRSIDGQGQVRTFLLTDSRSGRRFVVPIDPSGGRTFNDNRVWCYRRGRFCKPGEVPDPNFRWTDELQATYTAALANQRNSSSSQMSSSSSGRGVQSVTPVGSSGLLGQQ